MSKVKIIFTELLLWSQKQWNTLLIIIIFWKNITIHIIYNLIVKLLLKYHYN